MQALKSNMSGPLNGVDLQRSNLPNENEELNPNLQEQVFHQNVINFRQQARNRTAEFESNRITLLNQIQNEINLRDSEISFNQQIQRNTNLSIQNRINTGLGSFRNPNFATNTDEIHQQNLLGIQQNNGVDMQSLNITSIMRQNVYRTLIRIHDLNIDSTNCSFVINQ